MAERRKPPGAKLRRMFAENRIRRKFLQMEIDELAVRIDEAKTAKTAFTLSMERERLIATMRSLRVRRKATKSGRRSTGGVGAGGLRLFG